MKEERDGLTWTPIRTAPGMRQGIECSISVSTNSMDTVAPSGEDNANVMAWREVLVPSFTVLLTGAESAFMDFNFLPDGLPSDFVDSNDHANGAQSRFEDFIISLFNKIASAETETSGQRYVRRVDFHKLEEEKLMISTLNFPSL